MAQLVFKNIGIAAISTCVPKNVERNRDLSHLIPQEDIDKTIDSIGIAERRMADSDVCSSDLCFKAAEKLFADNQFDRNSIDALIFLSQTPDYRQPATSMALQDRLGIPKTAMCFDINLACSGYVYGLSVAYSLASNVGIKNVLLLVGETMSKTISKQDKVTAPLFGDAGTATIISKDSKFGDSYFVLGSDGSERDIINMHYGGYRNMSCGEDEYLHMNGMSVFNFGIRVVPRNIKELIAFANTSIEDVDYVAFHQANRFMTDFFAKKLKIDLGKLLYSLEYFGNTSSASIPLTLCWTANDLKLAKKESVVLSGFGAGVSWGSALVDLNSTELYPLIEY